MHSGYMHVWLHSWHYIGLWLLVLPCVCVWLTVFDNTNNNNNNNGFVQSADAEAFEPYRKLIWLSVYYHQFKRTDHVILQSQDYVVFEHGIYTIYQVNFLLNVCINQIFKTSAFPVNNDVVEKYLRAPVVTIPDALGSPLKRRLSVRGKIAEVSTVLSASNCYKVIHK